VVIRRLIFLFSEASKPAVGPTKSPVQCVLEVFYKGIKGPGREAGYSPPSSGEGKSNWSYASIHPYAFMACK